MNKSVNTFRSSDYSFRPTSLSEAMIRAGIINHPHLVREELVTLPTPLRKKGN